MKRILLFLSLIVIAGIAIVSYRSFFKQIGDKVDSFNGVAVYYNGSVGNISGRNVASNGYNLGMKYQCVEFVKRYYFEFYHHQMPNSYGNAKDFFNPKYGDGELNKERDLLQFKNGGAYKPKVGDLLVFNQTKFNQFGHVAIVSKVMQNEIEIVQQNPGPFGSSRAEIDLKKINDGWMLGSKNVLGWLRMKQ